MVAPTILAHGTDVTKDAYLTAMYRGDIVGCQLFSEPGAGSDLASLQTRAERDGDEWILNGQKVWTSGAQYSDIGEIIARTDPDLPKHKGLTGFVVDMRAPGVEIRPLRQMTGGASFNEVFFTDVRVPDSHRLGDVNNGWNVALTTLMNERAAIGAGGGGLGGGLLTRAIEMARAFGLTSDPLVRQKLADLVVHARVMQYTNQRAMDKIRSGQLPGPGDEHRQAGQHPADDPPDAASSPSCSARRSPPTPASGARTPGRSCSSARPAGASPAAATR